MALIFNYDRKNFGENNLNDTVANRRRMLERGFFFFFSKFRFLSWKLEDGKTEEKNRAQLSAM